MSEPAIRVVETEEINLSGVTNIDLDEIRRRGKPVMPDGQHAWVIGVMYGLDNPEQALDEMELGADKLLGFTNIHCLLCHQPYKSKEDRTQQCSQNPAVQKL